MTAWRPTWTSGSPDDWARGAGLPDPIVRWGPMPTAERLVRAELRHYPLWWRQLHGEELVATTLEGLEAEGFAGSRLPRAVRSDLRRGARRMSLEVMLTGLTWSWLWLTRGDVSRLDRWRARDLVLDRVAQGRQSAITYLFGFVMARALVDVLPGGWVSGVQFALVVVAAGLLTWAGGRALRRYRNDASSFLVPRRARMLARLGFTPAGVPLEWLPGPPLPPPPSRAPAPAA